MKFDDLYQEIILDHYRHPRNHAPLDHISDDAVHENPSCGDSLKLEVNLAPDGRIEKVRFDGHGCAISVASASMMTEIVAGLLPDEAIQAAAKVTAALRDGNGNDGDGGTRLEEFGDLAALAGVANFPLRVKCATLAWHALERSLLLRDGGVGGGGVR